ncbi:MAG: ABC transporter ATP-binding protein [Propionibacteriaceae bacterium]|jgi:peptide/nickel transport system ATP-binding protein|nr:ABC transporter ATP-binding protein [Propionibacteriaceae bacterium]
MSRNDPATHLTGQPPTRPLIRIDSLSVSYREQSAVRAANLEIAARETLAIVGESGSGKTTIANAIMGLLPAYANISGEIRLGDRQLIGPRGSWQGVRGGRIGYIPQDPMLSLNEVLTIGQHFKETILAHQLAPRSAWRELAAERLAEVGLADAARLRQYPHQISGGMRQRVLIALAVLARPELIIADEPSSALDVIVQKQVLDLLKRLTEQLGSSLVLITHDLGLVADRSDRVAVMKDGLIVEVGATAQVIGHPRHPYSKALLKAVPKLSSFRQRKAAAQSPVGETLAVTGLVKDFRLRRAKSADGAGRRAGKTLRAVDQVNLSIGLGAKGECVALVGESGSGKSTVAKLILGLEKPTAGNISFGAGGLGKLSRNERLQRCARIQVVFQDPYASLDPQFTVARTLLEPLAIHQRGGRFERQARIRELIGLVGLDDSVLDRYPSELSGGQRQRVAIARALALEPAVLVLDEAVSALDVLVQAQLLETLRELRQRLGLSMLFITHDLAVVAEIADKVAVIKAGKIVESGPVAEVFEEPSHPYTRELLAAVPGQSHF